MSKVTTPPARGTPEAVERRQARVDISRLNDQQRHYRTALIGFGQTAFGDRWKTGFAEAVGTELGRSIAVAQVSHWISGHRPVPKPVFDACVAIAKWRSEDMKRRSAILESMSWVDSREVEDGRVVVPEPPAAR